MTHLISKTYSKCPFIQSLFWTNYGDFYLKIFSAIVTSLCFLGHALSKACIDVLRNYVLLNLPQNKKNVHHNFLLFLFLKCSKFFLHFGQRGIAKLLFLVIMESSKNLTGSKCDLFSQQWLLFRVTDISSLSLHL